MNFLKRLLPRRRVRAAIKRLAQDRSARNYTALAQQYTMLGELTEVLRVCTEGLDAFPGNDPLTRLAERTRFLMREDRARALMAELSTAPRPAVWRELCEILLETGRIPRAEDLAKEWFEATRDGEAQYYRARARCERFFSDRRRDDGLQAFELITSAEELVPTDPRPIRLRVALTSRCGAWQDARRGLARLLELFPGDPALEARFRTVVTLAENSRPLDQALREIERSGRLVDDETGDGSRVSSRTIRPALQSLTTEPGVQAAFYVRGGTALVQGPRGPTAERAARSVREVVTLCRTASRRMGLGTPFEVRVEGDFGTLLIAPGEVASGALWARGPVSHRHELALRELAGVVELAQEASA
jgi:tetratricopeptide (TPR) repeat protein